MLKYVSSQATEWPVRKNVSNPVTCVTYTRNYTVYKSIQSILSGLRTARRTHTQFCSVLPPAAVRLNYYGETFICRCVVIGRQQPFILLWRGPIAKTCSETGGIGSHASGIYIYMVVHMTGAFRSSCCLHIRICVVKTSAGTRNARLFTSSACTFVAISE